MGIQRLNIGMPISLSGSFAEMGRQALDGLVAWVSDINSVGGIAIGPKRRLVNLIYDDDRGRKDVVDELTERMICNDRVDLLFGPYSSVLTNRAAQLATKYGKVLWNHGGATHKQCPHRGNRTIDVLTPADMYFHGVIDFVLNRDKCMGKIAIIYSGRGNFSRVVALGAVDHARQIGIPEPYMFQYYPSDQAFAPIMNLKRIYNADLILGVGRQEDDIALARTLLCADLPAHKIALIATPTQKFRHDLGALADGFIGPSQWEHIGVNKRDCGPSATVLGLTDSDYPRAQAYAAGLVAQRCVEKASTLDNHLLFETAIGMDFRTFYGRFKLDPVSHRQVGHQMVVVQLQDGAKRVVWPRGSICKLTIEDNDRSSGDNQR